MVDAHHFAGSSTRVAILAEWEEHYVAVYDGCDTDGDIADYLDNLTTPEWCVARNKRVDATW